MKLQNQVVSLEIAKKLKELGVKQDGLFCWTNVERQIETYDEGVSPVYERSDYWISNSTLLKWFKEDYEQAPEDIGQVKGNRFYSAFTVAELGELLPARIELGSEKLAAFLTISKHIMGTEHYIKYRFSLNPHNVDMVADTEANARGKMIIYLIENKLL